MGKNFIKRVGLILVALAFPLMSVPVAGATDGRASNSRTVQITMHSGPAAHEDYGRFEDGRHDEGNIHTRTIEVFFADSITDYTKPASNRDGYIFAGWSSDPEAKDVDVFTGEGKAVEIGSDIYAVWTDKVNVIYGIPDGVWENPETGDEYQYIQMNYSVGQNFQELPSQSTALRPLFNYLEFDGWYSDLNAKGTRYTTSSVIGDELESWIYAAWKYIPERIDNELTLGTDSDISIGVARPVYKFTAPESAIYEFYTKDINPDDDLHVTLRVTGDHTEELATEKPIDPTESTGNKHTYYEMEAGKTYYIAFGETYNNVAHFKAGVKKAEMVTVTFDANYGDNKAWFDGDHSKTTKEVEFPVGAEISSEYISGHEMDENFIKFHHWSLVPAGSDEDYYVMVTGPMTVYAQYIKMAAINLDYNGGYNPYDKNIHSEVVTFNRDTKFETPMDPKIDIPDKDFAGWSRNKNATEPDADIIEGRTASYELDGETLYAVWTDKVVVTFKTIGGAYMMDDPNATVFETTYGKGHIFYGMAVMHDNYRVEGEGWMDQDGNVTSVVSISDPDYRITGDTVFTSVLHYRMTAVGNGGHFIIGCGFGACEREAVPHRYYGHDSTFSYAEAKKHVGIPASDEEGKYFIGYATSPDATEPDIIDGETRLEDLGLIYAVWGDEYPAYIVDDATETAYEQRSEGGLRIVVKRNDDDNKTFSMFGGLTMDGETDEADDDLPKLLPESVYDAKKGSLVITLHSNYLDTLDTGGHTLTVHFNDIDSVDVDFTINPFIPDAPDTGVAE